MTATSLSKARSSTRFLSRRPSVAGLRESAWRKDTRVRSSCEASGLSAIPHCRESARHCYDDGPLRLSGTSWLGTSWPVIQVNLFILESADEPFGFGTRH